MVLNSKAIKKLNVNPGSVDVMKSRPYSRYDMTMQFFTASGMEIIILLKR